jgi:hypothetical protein
MPTDPKGEKSPRLQVWSASGLFFFETMSKPAPSKAFKAANAKS